MQSLYNQVSRALTDSESVQSSTQAGEQTESWIKNNNDCQNKGANLSTFCVSQVVSRGLMWSSGTEMQGFGVTVWEMRCFKKREGKTDRGQTEK